MYLNLRVDSTMRGFKKVWLWPLILLTCTNGEKTCPRTQQDYGLYENLNLGKIPRDLPPSITTLNIGHNSLASLTAEQLLPYTKVSVLIINHNQLEQLEDKAFVHLPGLCKLDLSHNKLKRIDNVIFERNTNLGYLMLNHNNFSLDPASPFLTSSTITKLELQGCGIHEITTETFSNIPELSYLDLRNNTIRRLDSYSFARTKLDKLFIDITSRTESNLTVICQSVTSVYFIRDNSINDFCKVNEPTSTDSPGSSKVNEPTSTDSPDSSKVNEPTSTDSPDGAKTAPEPRDENNMLILIPGVVVVVGFFLFWVFCPDRPRKGNQQSGSSSTQHTNGQEREGAESLEEGGQG